jgi:hypothetical protein
MNLLKRRSLILIASVTLLTLGMIGFASTWQGPLGNMLVQKASAAEKNAAAPAQPLVALVCDGGNNVDVEATGGTALAGYATVGAAFAAINAGTHTGTIKVEVCANTTEGATPALLLGSGQGTASYTSIEMYPLADGLTISGTQATGFGIIQLKGVDNFTLNGDNPNTAGINRNLTISSASASTVDLTSVIRIATVATLAASADNITLKNTNILGNASGRNASTFTSAAGPENRTWGIYVGGNGGATATDAPTALSNVSTNIIPAATTVNNFSADNNTLNIMSKGINFNGAATSNSTSVSITNNVIGDGTVASPATPPYTSPVSTVYTKGISVAGTNSVNIFGNTVQNITSYVLTSISGIELTAAIGSGPVTIGNNTVNTVVCNSSTSSSFPTRGIVILNSASAYTISNNSVTNVQNFTGSTTGQPNGITVGTAAPSGTIERNKIQTVINRNTGTFGSYGMFLGGGNNINVRNNFISGVNQVITGSASFLNCCGVYGMIVGSGTGHKIYNNTISLSGVLLGTSTADNSTAALFVTSTALTGLDIRNNILADTMTGGTTTTGHISLALPASGTSAMNLTLNNNDYFSGATVGQSGIAHVGTTYTAVPAGPTTFAGLYLAADFNAGSTSPIANLRAYTSTLSAAGTNDNASKVVDPQFVSATDLHILAGSPMVDAGDPSVTGVGVDIDGQFRVGNPDIGADEPGGITPPANDISATAFVTPTNGSSVAQVVILSPQASFSNIGTATQTSVNVQFTITGPGGYSYSNSQVIPSIIAGTSTTVTFASAPAFVSTGAYSMSASVTTPDANPGNDTITGGFTVSPPVSAALSVPGSYPSLTNPGGAFEAINNLGAAANVTISITADLTGETGSVPLNQVPGGFTVTIKPTGAPRAITSTATAVSVIKLNDADGVTVDGSLVGGTDRSLSITNINTAASVACVWIASNVNGAQNNTIKNLNLAGGVDQSVTSTGNFAIISSSSASILTGGTDNDGTVIRNNFIRKVGGGILALGGLASNMNQNTIIADNTIGPAAFGVDEIANFGILGFNENNLNITNNEIRFVGDNGTATGSAGRDHVGITLCTGAASWTNSTTPTLTGSMTNALVNRNHIHDILEKGTFSAAGIVNNCAFGGLPTTNTFANNMLHDIRANGTSGDQTVGVGISQGNGDTYVHNSLYMGGDLDPAGATSASTSSFGFRIQTTAVLNPTLRDNISVMDLTSNTVTLFNSAMDQPAAYSYGTGNSNFNDLFAPAGNAQARVGSVGGNAGTFHTTLAAWQTATTQDANSLSVDPLFVSTTDLHITGASTLQGVGTPIAAVPADYDTDLRDNVPDIGADEISFSGRAGAIPPGTYRNAVLQAGSLTGDTTFTGAVQLTGIITNGANTMIFGCTASATGGGPTSYVIGNVRKDFCATGAFTYPVGTTPNGAARTEELPEGALPGEYSPVDMTINSGVFPSSLTVNVVDTWLPGLGQTSSTSRYWNVTETGDINADMTFHYLNEDVYGVEGSYQVFKWNGVSTVPYSPSTTNTAGNTFTASNVSSFSGWAAGVVAPTSANGNISGRVTTANGMPIANVKMVLTGGELDGALVVYTGSLGYYNFENIPFGQNYVVTVKSRRFFFSNPSQLITLLDSVNDRDFTADPQ